MRGLAKLERLVQAGRAPDRGVILAYIEDRYQIEPPAEPLPGVAGTGRPG